MKEVLIRMLSSTLKATAVSIVFGIAAYVTGISVIMTLVVSFISQFVVFYLYGSYLEIKAAKVLKEQQLKELEILSRITFTINCAYS